jgi:excisionase family DNA binding protein
MRLLRIEEVAERLGLKPSTVRKMIQLHQLPAVRPTRRAVRVREEDVEALIRLGHQERTPRLARRKATQLSKEVS